MRKDIDHEGMDELDEEERMTEEERIAKYRHLAAEHPYTPGVDPLLDAAIAAREVREQTAPPSDGDTSPRIVAQGKTPLEGSAEGILSALDAVVSSGGDEDAMRLLRALLSALPEGERGKVLSALYGAPIGSEQTLCVSAGGFQLMLGFRVGQDEETKEPTVTLAAPSVAPPHPLYLHLLHGAGTTQLKALSRKAFVDSYNGNFEASLADYTAVMTQKGGVSVGAQKLLDLAGIAFTGATPYRVKEGAPINTQVVIPLEDYARYRGFDLPPREAVMSEQARKRRANVLRDVRKQASAELACLYSLSLSWKECRKGKAAQQYMDMRILQEKGIKSGAIVLRFTEPFARYLANSFVMLYPMKLQELDERDPLSFQLGYKLALHYSIRNNQAIGTNRTISVAALLRFCTYLPSFEEVERKDRGHWGKRIQDPLERALDTLKGVGILSMWEYCNSKGDPLTEAQLAGWDYYAFAKLFIRYELEEDNTQPIGMSAKE